MNDKNIEEEMAQSNAWKPVMSKQTEELYNKKKDMKIMNTRIRVNWQDVF